jgi:hypothetical protein
MAAFGPGSIDRRNAVIWIRAEGAKVSGARAWLATHERTTRRRLVALQLGHGRLSLNQCYTSPPHPRLRLMTIAPAVRVSVVLTRSRQRPIVPQ